MSNSDSTENANSGLCYICQMVQGMPVGIWTTSEIAYNHSFRKEKNLNSSGLDYIQASAWKSKVSKAMPNTKAISYTLRFCLLRYARFILGFLERVSEILFWRWALHSVGTPPRQQDLHSLLPNITI